MTDITIMDQIPTKRPRGRPKKYVTEEERLEIRRANDRKYYNQNSEAKKENVRLYYIENRDAIRERKRLYYLRQKEEKLNLVN
jgi:hypothetical protein